VASGSTHILDALCATYELASRAESRLAACEKDTAEPPLKLLILWPSLGRRLPPSQDRRATGLCIVTCRRPRPGEEPQCRTSAVVELATVLDPLDPRFDASGPITNGSDAAERPRHCRSGLVVGTGKCPMSSAPSFGIHSIRSRHTRFCDAIEWPIFIFSVPHPPSTGPLHHAVLFPRDRPCAISTRSLATIQILCQRI